VQSETFEIGGWQTGCLHRSKFAALKVLNPLNYEVDIWGYIDDFESKIVGIMNYQKIKWRQSKEFGLCGKI